MQLRMPILRNKWTIYYTCFSLLLILSLVYGSRAFLFGIITSVVIVSCLFQGSRKFSLKLILSGVAIIGLLAFLSVYLKRDSSLGRLLIYKISWSMFRENYWTGVGNFQANYLEYQADYFCNGAFTEKEMLLADNTYFALNDYWQLIVEYGLSAILILAGVLFIIFFLL
jgi:O-antigen ligase